MGRVERARDVPPSETVVNRTLGVGVIGLIALVVIALIGGEAAATAAVAAVGTIVAAVVRLTIRYLTGPDR